MHGSTYGKLLIEVENNDMAHATHKQATISLSVIGNTTKQR
jgi:hypothetical protein